MKKISVLIVALFCTSAAFSGNGAVHFSGTEQGWAYIECLDVTAYVDIEWRAVQKIHNDGSGGFHFVTNVRYVGTADTFTGMSWTVRGGGPGVINSNVNNSQGQQTFFRHEVWQADGDYADLLKNWTQSFAYNANGELVSLRFEWPPTFTCLPTS